jgi:hypothetical protein
MAYRSSVVTSTAAAQAALGGGGDGVVEAVLARVRGDDEDLHVSRR